MNDEEKIKKEPQDMGAVVLMLGLYLIVLAFFILLNAISQSSEEKVQKASQSVAEGFGFQLSGPVNMRDDVDVTINPVFDIIAREIQSVLESYASVRNYKLSANADQMIMRLDTKDVFSPGSVRIRPAMANFFEEIAKVVSSHRPGTHMMSQVTVMLNESDRGATKLDLRELAGRRATLFVRALIERGVKPEYISAATNTEDKSEVEIFFKVIITDAQEASQTARELEKKGTKKRLNSAQIPNPYPTTH